MPNTKRIVLDTNTIISALLLRTSVSRQAFDKALDQGVVLASESTVAELVEVVKRPRFDPYVTLERRIQFVAGFMHVLTIVSITETITDCRDAKDNKFLEVAVSGQADYLISGDRDLLEMSPYRGIAIMTPREYSALP